MKYLSWDLNSVVGLLRTVVHIVDCPTVRGRRSESGCCHEAMPACKANSYRGVMQSNSVVRERWGVLSFGGNRLSIYTESQWLEWSIRERDRDRQTDRQM
jgi:hypothetical protein